MKTKFRFSAKRKAKKELIEKIRANSEKIGENDYLNADGRRFVVSGKHFIIYEPCN